MILNDFGQLKPKSDLDLVNLAFSENHHVIAAEFTFVNMKTAFGVWLKADPFKIEWISN